VDTKGEMNEVIKFWENCVAQNVGVSLIVIHLM